MYNRARLVPSFCSSCFYFDFAEHSRNTPKMRRLKIKIVGDGNVGKTCFLIRWYNENFPPSPSERRPAFPENCVPPVQDPYYTSITVDRTSYVLTYWDTLIAPEFHKFRRMEYQETDVFLACFDIANPSSFQNVSTVWVPELKHFMPETPILVVGNKKDLRSTAYVLPLLNSNTWLQRVRFRI